MATPMGDPARDPRPPENPWKNLDLPPEAFAVNGSLVRDLCFPGPASPVVPSYYLGPIGTSIGFDIVPTTVLVLAICGPVSIAQSVLTANFFFVFPLFECPTVGIPTPAPSKCIPATAAIQRLVTASPPIAVS
ncbi:uncharacterized protein TRUGW13939_03849 [Talaromyces rugulosus]|uniref:Uncharacterized protein n=1 Tax=Talaromyces rugulosus TaxID=121627 RepID=A0A7H8QV04_TALRU|nr:uncharacterized protein TRUGW13939_03849 [Talaromyces rugulosus]QKX56743.1 hypothetical protein TRUGW13939_03849 [Talaromyces rugulosus]